jgi:hypothetical protein
MKKASDKNAPFGAFSKSDYPRKFMTDFMVLMQYGDKTADRSKE